MLTFKKRGRAGVEPATQVGDLLDVSNLRVSFSTAYGELRAVDGVDLHVARGEMVALAGESGSGKSALARALVGLLPRNSAVSGSIRFEGAELTTKSERQLRRYRGAQLAMVFQDPMRSLNPLMPAGAQIVEAIRFHRPCSGREARARATELLRLVRISEAERRFDAYPHQLSGGMRQRVMIAVALAGQPKLLIADEPTTALDVTTQAAIMQLIGELRRELGMAVLLITHDLNLAARYADRICVMYGGKILEEARWEQVFAGLRVPYARSLIDAIPDPRREPHSPLAAIGGASPDPLLTLPGCRFAPRCPGATAVCRQDEPSMSEGGDGHRWACWNPLGQAGDVAGLQSQAEARWSDGR
jgi:oligopeptide/dipeptide ABC transporter ATP-binding protein